MYHSTILASEKALSSKQFVKLIVGASFTDTNVLRFLIETYADTGISCIDISCNTEMIDVAEATLAKLGKLDEIAIMVSFALDDDPHFRKIELDRNACIDCGACIPVCPTTVFSMTQLLQVDTPKCYGCSRCLPICPTEALYLEPFKQMAGLLEALNHPAVSAVEIHSEYADSEMLVTLFTELGSTFKDKKIAICFRPQNFTRTHNAQFIETLQAELKAIGNPYKLLFQIDGKPMSATDEKDASLPALEAAKQFKNAHPKLSESLDIMISGGINAHTADFLQEPQYGFIQGTGLGTTARTWVWAYQDKPEKAQLKAKELIRSFIVEKNFRKIAKATI